MAVLRIVSRGLAFLVGLAFGAAAAVALAVAYAPESGPAELGGDLVGRLVSLAGEASGRELEAEPLLEILAQPVGRFGLPAVALALLAFAVFPRRRAEAEAEEEAGVSEGPSLDRAMRKKADKQVKQLLKSGDTLGAAELCFATDMSDRAVELFVDAGELVRAAEIRHDQNQFAEAAELYEKAGRFESAAAIHSEQEDWGRAAECFLQAGRKSMAAEMFEKAGQHARAGECFAEADFHRHAAQCFVRCQRWAQAAASLEEVIGEEGAKAFQGGDPKKEREFKKLVLQTGKLWEQAGEREKAFTVLEKGRCWEPAAELGMVLERFAQAAELFQKARQPLRAAEALQRLGEGKAAAQILGEFHRDQGDDEPAAAAFLEAGDHLSAGDLYRKLQDFEKAGDCYEKNHDMLQAAEMFRLADKLDRAATCYEAARRFTEAAECYAEAGDGRKEAELLERAGKHLLAGEAYHRQGLDDEAIKVLQKVDSESGDNPQASALLGAIFKSRGMFSLSIKKLKQAIGTQELTRANISAFYALAVVHDANRQFREAVDLYEKILACDYHYENVEDRLEAAREKLKLAEMKNEGTATGPPSGSSLTPTGGSRYQIVSELGRGGMGIVYKAHDTVLDRVVAYKVLPDALKENPQALKNFLREAKSAAQLNHPNIVTVYDAGEQDGRYFIAMEYVEGTTLKEILKRRGPIAPGGVMHVLAQMCEALAYAHEKKIVHRDVKTANTMWTREKKAKIMDFGLAKVMEEVRNHTTLVSGTPYYMSPEQTLGRNVDHRTDVYSLGVTLFELCTARLPFMEGNIPYHHVHTPPPDVREVNAQVPDLLAEIIGRCMEKDPDARYATTREILEQLKAAKAARP